MDDNRHMIWLVVIFRQAVPFRATEAVASPTFINQIVEYRGTIYLVNGPRTTDDQIILHINEPFQATVTVASPTFINRTGEYPGTIYLVDGPRTTDDRSTFISMRTTWQT